MRECYSGVVRVQFTNASLGFIGTPPDISYAGRIAKALKLLDMTPRVTNVAIIQMATL